MRRVALEGARHFLDGAIPCTTSVSFASTPARSSLWTSWKSEDEAPHGVRELGYEHEAEHRGHARMDAAPTSASSQSNDAEQRLCGMGFSASSVAAALLACGGDEAEAVEMLLSQ